MSNRISALLLAAIVVTAGAAGAAYWWHVSAAGNPPAVTIGPLAPQLRSDFGLQARVFGRVIDAGSREPIADAMVRLYPFSREVVTDEVGRFSIDVRIPPDHCPRTELMVVRQGGTRSRTEVFLRPGNNTVGDVPLRSAADTPDERIEPTEPADRPACARGGRR